MVSRKLKRYIKENLRTRSFLEIKNELLKSNWPEKKVEKAFNNIIHPTHIGMIVILSVITILLLGSLYGYFFVVNPIFVSKPDIAKPQMIILTNNSSANYSAIKVEHILYLLNEIGAYKLHNSPSGDISKIEFVISDTSKKYSFTVTDNYIVKMDNLNNFDVRITATQNSIISVFNSNISKTEIMKNYNNGDIKFDTLAEMSTLALKGYTSLYDYFELSGEVILENLSSKDRSLYFVILPFMIIALLIAFMRAFLALKTKRNIRKKKHSKI